MTSSGGNLSLPSDKLSETVPTSGEEWVLAFGYPNGFTVRFPPKTSRADVISYERPVFVHFVFVYSV